MRLKPKIIPLSTRIGLLIAAGGTIGGQGRRHDSSNILVMQKKMQTP